MYGFQDRCLDHHYIPTSCLAHAQCCTIRMNMVCIDIEEVNLVWKKEKQGNRGKCLLHILRKWMDVIIPSTIRLKQNGHSFQETAKWIPNSELKKSQCSFVSFRTYITG